MSYLGYRSQKWLKGVAVTLTLISPKTKIIWGWQGQNGGKMGQKWVKTYQFPYKSYQKWLIWGIGHRSRFKDEFIFGEIGISVTDTSFNPLL